MKILVTGGAGFIASHIVDALIERGDEVVVIDDLSTGVEANLNPEAKFVKVDIRSDEAYELVKSSGFDLIDHHAAHIHVGRSVEKPRFDADVNIMGTLNLLNAAKDSGTVKQVIFASTGGAMYGDKDTPFEETMIPQPFSPYGISKRACELYMYFFMNQYGITYTSLRYANVYGPRQNPHGEAGVISIFFEALEEGKQPVINGDGKQTRDYVFVADVVRANMLAVDQQVAGEFNIGTGVETDVNQIYDLVAGAADSKVKAKHGPERPGEQQTSSLNYDKAKKVLGWKPQVHLDKGITATKEFFYGN
jgi:UDP-glucose 4-epimerase